MAYGYLTYGWEQIILGVILLIVAIATLIKNCSGFKNPFAMTMNVFSIGYSVQFIVFGTTFLTSRAGPYSEAMYKASIFFSYFFYALSV